MKTNPYQCEYCGSNEDINRDHVIPKSFSGTESFRDSIFNPMVYSCKNCNVILGNRAPHTFEDRASFIYKRLMDKHGSLLKIPDWDESDYEGMNPKFAKKIKLKELKKRNIKARLENLDRVRWGL